MSFIFSFFMSLKYFSSPERNAQVSFPNQYKQIVRFFKIRNILKGSLKVSIKYKPSLVLHPYVISLHFIPFCIFSGQGFRYEYSFSHNPLVDPHKQLVDL